MERYENYFEVTESLYCEALKRMIPAARYIVYAVAVTFLAVSAGVMLYGGNIKVGVLWLVLALCLGFYGFYGVVFRAKTLYRRQIPDLRDKNGVFWKRTSFSEKKIHVQEPHTAASFDYADIISVRESKNLYILLLKNKNLLFVKKDAFKNATNAEFIAMLKEKCGLKAKEEE